MQIYNLMITKIDIFKENILVPRNLESRQEKLKQEAIKLLSQETIDGDFKLEKYMLDIPEDLVKVKTINGDLNCDNMNLTKLPKWFKNIETVNGNFDCQGNKLETLEYCPKTINGNFYANGNELTSLIGCSEYIKYNFSINDNNLKTLEYGPKFVGLRYYCHYNNLKSLKGCPEKLFWFNCSYNNLLSLKDGPKEVEKDYICYRNKKLAMEIKLKKPDDCIVGGEFKNVLNL